MAIRLLRPSVGSIKVLPQESYEGTTNRYASELMSALRSEENAIINNKLRAFEEGSLSFKSLKSYLDDLAANYPKDSSRYVDIQGTISDARRTQIRIGDTRLQNELLERYGSDVSEGELREMWNKRISYAREQGAPKYDPEFWNSLLTGQADMESRLSRAGAGTAADEAVDAIRLEISQNESDYQSGQMTGNEKDYANFVLSKSLYESGKMNATEMTDFVQYGRDLADRDITVGADGKGILGNNGILADVMTLDENGRTVFQAASQESLKNRYEARATPDGDWAVYDNVTGAPVPGGTYSSQGEKGAGAQGFATADADARNNAGHDFSTPTGIVHGVWDESQGAWRMDTYDENGQPTGNFTYTSNPSLGIGEARAEAAAPAQQGLGEQIKGAVGGAVETLKAGAGELGKRFEEKPQQVALETALATGAATKVIPPTAKALVKLFPWVAKFLGGAVTAGAKVAGRLGRFALPYWAASEIIGSAETIRKMATLKTPEEQESFIRGLSPLSISGLGAKGAFALRKPLEQGGINDLIQSRFNRFYQRNYRIPRFNLFTGGTLGGANMPQPWVYTPTPTSLTPAEEPALGTPSPGLNEALRGSYIDEQGQLKFR